MQRTSYLPLVLAAACAAFLYYGGQARPGPAPAPAPLSGGPDLRLAFATNSDRGEAQQHAHIFATICTSLADCIEYDGSREAPLLKTGVQIDELRRGLRQTRMKGWSFMARYPDLGPVVDTFLTAEVGTSGGPLAPEQRAKWISALRRLAASSEAAAR